MHTVLVTGGAGFIGVNYICHLLSDSSFTGRIINLDKLTYAGNLESLADIDTKFGGKRYFFEHADICDNARVQTIFQKYQPDTVVNFAAESHVDRSIDGPLEFVNTNVTGTAGHGSERNQLALKSAFFTLLVIFLPVFRFGLRLTSKVDIDFWLALFFVLPLLCFINSPKRYSRLLQISAIVLLVFALSGLFSTQSSQKGAYSRKTLSAEMSQISFNEKPNIYLFVYDGIPNERVFAQQKMPFQNLKDLLSNYGFKLYPDTYSLGDASLNSMGRTFDFTNRVIKSPEGRDIYSGNSYTNLILRNNGYKSRFLLDNYFTGYNAVTHQDLFDEMYPPRSANSSQSDYLIVLLRGVFQGEMRFDTKGLVVLEEVDIQAYKQEIIKENKQNTFVVNHYHYPGHSQNSGKCLPNETELWLEKLDIALVQMEKDFQAIQEYDPGSIAIAIGDHGPSLTGDCFDLAAWKKEEITEELIWDRIGTMVAVRWPNAEKETKYDFRIIKNQDIFPVVFSYLADSSEPLDLCPDDTFWGLATPFRTDIGFDKGKIILER